jgi:putative membrane protein
MRGFLVRLLINGLALYVASAVVSGFHVAGWGSLLVAALLLGIVNAIVRPVLIILTLPITLITLGFFLLIVNGISLALVAWLVPGVTVTGIWAATVAALIVSLTSWLASAFVGSSGRVERLRSRGVETTGRIIE